VVVRSTVLPGTNRKITETIEKISGKKRDRAFATVSNPEFLREGSAVHDYYHPPFTLIGSANAEAISKMKQVYSEIDAPLIVSDVQTAEIIKYVNNAFHALKITFANEIGNICSKIGIDSHQLMDIFCQDRKLNLSSTYLKPGFSFGGSCLPKDLKALKTIAHDHYLESPLLENIQRSNENQKNLVYEKILGLNKQKLGFLGLSFKGGTDDLRNSPIVDIIERLLGKGFDVRVYDKNVRLSQLVGANKEYILKKIPYISKFIVDDPDELLAQSEALIVVNNEKDYSRILEQASDEQFIFDLVNIDFKKRNQLKNYHGIAW
jgi:GDP-mannose 6-dehydrogenase